MKLLDRFSLQKADIEDIDFDQVVPYQYCLTEDLRVSSKLTLPSGTVLGKDGWSVVFGKATVKKYPTINDIALEAVIQISNAFISWQDTRLEEGGSKLPNPLVPSNLFQQSAKLTDFEVVLERVMVAKHLYQINNQPRMDIQYREELVATSRAKKISNRAHRYLASHSETWQEKTLSGIYPKKLLAKVSDDEIAIYENRVYARLLDKIQLYLKRRLKNLQEDKNSLVDALSIEQNENMYFRLRDSLCMLWGDNLTHDEAERLLDHINDTYLQNLAMDKKISNLKKIGLYSQITEKQKIIPNQLHNTNILLHDQHYRHLRRLWVELHRATQKRKTLEERIIITMEFQQSYNQYVSLLILYTLEGLGFQVEVRDQAINAYRNAFKIEINVDEYSNCWYIKSNYNAHLLRVLPYTSLAEESIAVLVNDNLLVCAIDIDESLSKLDNTLLANPLNLEVIESFTVRLFKWLYLPIVQGYGDALNLGRVPTSITNVLNNIQALNADDGYAVENEIFDKDLKEIESECKQSNTDEIYAEIVLKHEQVKILKQCLVCNKEVDFEPRISNRTFVAECYQCASVYKTESDSQGKRVFTLTPSNQNSYDRAGRWHVSFSVDL